MKLHDRELTIQQILEEANHEPTESGKFRLLLAWRTKLAREPHLLQAFQIDEILREVWSRLTSVSLPPSSSSPRTASFTSTMSSPCWSTR